MKNLFSLFSLGFILTIALWSSYLLPATAQFSQDPLVSPFVTEDIGRFWGAFDRYLEDTTANPFEEYYIIPGSAGVQDFIPYRIQSSEYLFGQVKSRTAQYKSIRETSLRMKDKEQECREAFKLFQDWYPDAQFPPVYFVVGTFNSGGTASRNGLIIGAEMQDDLEKVPKIVSHELVHFQQEYPFPGRPSLLFQSIKEGSADFIGELICGAHINDIAFAYGSQHEARLCKEFVGRMDETDYSDWLYGTSGKDDRPNDLGYWMGYQITKRYFDKAKDKKLAIREILHIEDMEQFLKESGYLDNYLN